jgi:hypothetical protein
MEFVFALAARHSTTFNDAEIGRLLQSEYLPDEQRVRITGDPFTAANDIAGSLIVGIGNRADVSLAFTYFHVNEPVDFPRYMCADCYETGKDPYAGGMPEYLALTDFDASDRLSYPLERGFEPTVEVAEPSITPGIAEPEPLYTGGGETTTVKEVVYVHHYYPRWYSAWFYDPWDYCGYYPRWYSPYRSGVYISVGWGWGYPYYYGNYYHGYGSYRYKPAGYASTYDVVRRSIRPGTRYKGTTTAVASTGDVRTTRTKTGAVRYKSAGTSGGYAMSDRGYKVYSSSTRPVHKVGTSTRSSRRPVYKINRSTARSRALSQQARKRGHGYKGVYSSQSKKFRSTSSRYGYRPGKAGARSYNPKQTIRRGSSSSRYTKSRPSRSLFRGSTSKAGRSVRSRGVSTKSRSGRSAKRK